MDDQPSQRHFQFSLSTLFGVTLLVAIWAWGTRVIEPGVGFDGVPSLQNFEWFLFTAFMGRAVWILIGAAARHQQRVIGRGKTAEPPLGE
jgi:hypothetical protein